MDDKIPPNNLNFNQFIKQAFATTNPGIDYIHNWHIDLISDYITAIEQGEIKRLIINIPPRYLKSHIVSVSWPAWIMAKNPTERVICASYSQMIANRHSMDTRFIMNSDWYKEAFLATRLCKGQNQKNKFATTEHGFRFATSIGGSITGDGANFLILDDPHNPTHINSKTKRENVHSWFEQTFSTRLNDKKKGAIIIIMQRLHPNDLCGYLLDKSPNKWELLKIPAIADKDYKYHIMGKDYEFKESSLIFPERDGIEELNSVKEDLGVYNFSAQYLQSPILSVNGIIKPEWIRQVNNIGKLVDYQIIQSWDTAFKVSDKSDYSVCITACVSDNDIYIIDVLRAKLEYNDLIRKVLEMQKKYNPYKVLIEDKAAGQSIIQEISKNSHIPVIPIRPIKDKITRLMEVSGYFESGKVYMLNGAYWSNDFFSEIINFPSSDHDDQVDALSQLIGYIKLSNNDIRKISRL